MSLPCECHVRLSSTYYHDHGVYLDPDGDWEDAGNKTEQYYCQPRLLNTIMRLLINKIPTKIPRDLAVFICFSQSLQKAVEIH